MGVYKLNIGDAVHFLKWDGVNLTIKGMVAAGSITLDSNGFIKTTGKDSYADITAGFFLGYDGEAYKLNLGNSGNYLKWNGITLQIKGRLNVGYGTDADIYFQDSGVRMYDLNNNIIAIDKTNYERLQLSIYSNGVQVGGDTSCSHIAFFNTGLAQIHCVSNLFNFYSTGTFQLPSLTNEPTGHAGDLAYDDDGGANPKFHGYIGPPDNAWGHWSLTSGW